MATTQQNNIAGYIFCEIQHEQGANLIPHTTLYIDDLCVGAAYRKHHVASKLFQFICDYAKSSGYYNITLNVWEGNSAARAFYDKMNMFVRKTRLEAIL